MTKFKTPKDALRHHVTGAIQRGEKQAIVEQKAQHEALQDEIIRLNDANAELSGALATAENFAELGLNSSDPKHWEAALQDVLSAVRKAIAKATNENA